MHCRKKRQIPAAFWPLFKKATFEFCKNYSFAAFIMPKQSADRKFRPFGPPLIFCRHLKLKNLLHKSIFMAQKLKNLELRGFAHLLSLFKNCLGL